MKMMSWWAAAAAVLVLGCSRQPPPAPMTKTVDMAYDGGTIDLHVGDTLVVRLEGNPTTGYTWESATEAMPSLKQIGEKQYVRDASDRVGSGGYFEWTFEATAVGTTHLKLEYLRPFEQGEPPVKTWVAAVQVF